MKQNEMQMIYFFVSATRKLRIALNTHKNKHPLRNMAQGYYYKTNWTDSENSDTMARSG
jgi:hypothetical protein